MYMKLSFKCFKTDRDILVIIQNTRNHSDVAFDNYRVVMLRAQGSESMGSYCLAVQYFPCITIILPVYQLLNLIHKHNYDEQDRAFTIQDLTKEKARCSLFFLKTRTFILCCVKGLLITSNPQNKKVCMLLNPSPKISLRFLLKKFQSEIECFRNLPIEDMVLSKEFYAVYTNSEWNCLICKMQCNWFFPKIYQ